MIATALMVREHPVGKSVPEQSLRIAGLPHLIKGIAGRVQIAKHFPILVAYR